MTSSNDYNISTTDLDFSARILTDFFIEMKSAFLEMDPEVLANNELRTSLNNQLFTFMSIHLQVTHEFFENFFFPKPEKVVQDDTVYVVVQTPNKLSRRQVVLQFLKKHNVHQIAQFFKLEALSKAVLRKLHVFDREESEIPVKEPIAPPPQTTIDFDFITQLMQATNKQLQDMSAKLVALNLNLISDALNDVNKFNANPSENKCVVITGGIPPTWAPTFEALQNKDWHVAYIIQARNTKPSGYGTLLDQEVKGEIFVNQFLGMMIFVTKLKDNAVVMLSGESYHFVDFFADRCVLMNLTLSCVTKTIKRHRNEHCNRLVFLMYDGLKPVSKLCVEMKQELSKYYVRFLQTADKIIFNSNAEAFGDFVENTYGITKPRLHFLRYSTTVNDFEERYGFGANNDEFHIVTITAAFASNKCTSRTQTHTAIREILEQGIHFHSYTGESQEVIDQFLQTVSTPFRKFLHVHAVNRNQNELVRELHKYHAGFNGSDYVMFAEGIVALKDRKYLDGLFTYMHTTYATSFLVYAAAGLPILVPRFASEAIKNFGKFSIPVCFSECRDIKSYLHKHNLPKLCKEYTELLPKGRVDNQIDRLVNFLDVARQ